MIMEWKKKSDGTFHATWRGAHLVLVENPVTGRWHMLADDKVVRQNWPSSRRAMNDVEDRQQRIILQASRALVEEKAVLQHEAGA